MAVKKLFEPVQTGNLKLKNRLVRSAAWEGLAEEDGSISGNTYEICRELAKVGAGMIIPVPCRSGLMTISRTETRPSV